MDGDYQVIHWGEWTVMPEAERIKTSPVKLGPRDTYTWCQVGAGASFPQSNRKTSLSWVENGCALQQTNLPTMRGSSWRVQTWAVHSLIGHWLVYTPFLLFPECCEPYWNSGQDGDLWQIAQSHNYTWLKAESTRQPCPIIWDTTGKRCSRSMRKASVSPNQRFLTNNINKCSDLVASTQ